MKKTPTEQSPGFKDTDLCVMCGMCLPHCPTYRVYQNEAESPRGRISLIQAYSQGRLSTDSNMIEHLDHCLGCMACEAMCPSRVPYGRLLDTARASLAKVTRQPFLQRQLLHAVTRKGGLAHYSKLLKLTRLSGLAGVAKLISGASGRPRMGAWLEQLQPHSFDRHNPARQDTGRRVALFSGCMGTSLDADTLASSIRVLNGLGFNVEIPENQVCCGALHQHNGFPKQAAQLARDNKGIFEALDVDAVIYTSNGCGAQLAGGLSDLPVMDIITFLLAQPALKSCHLDRLNQNILLHESCSSLNKLALEGRSRRLLEHIPGIRLHSFGTARLCCGAGGSHQLTHPDLSTRLRSIKMFEIKQLEPDCLVTDNLGCGLNFKTGLAQAGLDIEVIHPVTLLARQMK